MVINQKNKDHILEHTLKKIRGFIMKVKLTRGGVCYELKNTPFKETFIYGDNKITFHFSSQYNLDSFLKRLKKNREKINESLSNRFNIYIEFNVLSDIKLYESIEKRGFLITDSNESYLCLNTIKLSGVIKTTKN